MKVELPGFLNPVNTQTAEDFLQNGIKKNELKDFQGAILDYNKAIE